MRLPEFSAHLKRPLVDARYQRRTYTFGGELIFDTQDAVHRALLEKGPRLNKLLDDCGVLVCRTNDTPLTIDHNRLSGVFHNTRHPEPTPDRSLEFHVDGNIRIPGTWSRGILAIWQNACRIGRYASFVVAPSQMVADVIGEIAHEAHEIANKYPEDTPLSRIAPQDSALLLPFYYLVDNRSDTTQYPENTSFGYVLAFGHAINAITHAKSGHVSSYERQYATELNDRVINRALPCSIEMDWQKPENVSGALVLVRGVDESESDRPFVHARRNKGKVLSNGHLVRHASVELK